MLCVQSGSLSVILLCVFVFVVVSVSGACRFWVRTLPRPYRRSRPRNLWPFAAGIGLLLRGFQTAGFSAAIGSWGLEVAAAAIGSSGLEAPRRPSAPRACVGEASQKKRKEADMHQYSRNPLVLHRRRGRCSGGGMASVDGAGQRFREEPDVPQHSRSSLVLHRQTGGELVYQTICVGEAGQRFREEADKLQYLCSSLVLHRRIIFDASGNLTAHFVWLVRLYGHK